jgi:hypothetical protein
MRERNAFVYAKDLFASHLFHSILPISRSPIPCNLHLLPPYTLVLLLLLLLILHLIFDVSHLPLDRILLDDTTCANDTHVLL